MQIPVLPHRAVTASIVIQAAAFATTYHARLRYTGNVIWTADDGTTHIIYKSAVGVFFERHPYPPVTVVDYNTIEVSASGTFTGVEGIDDRLVSTESDAGP
jgi:hypothetical protein